MRLHGYGHQAVMFMKYRLVFRSLKYKQLSGAENVIPIRITDIDFLTLPDEEEALIKKADRGTFGYTETEIQEDKNDTYTRKSI